MLIVNGLLQEGNNINSSTKFSFDSGFNFARGVFETILILKKPVLMDRHLQRMNNSLKTLKIHNNISETYIYDLIKKFNITNCVLKIIITDKNVIISTRLPNYSDDIRNKGFNVKISNLKRNRFSHVVYHKTLNYTDNLIEKEIAAEEGFEEVIFLNTENKLSEGSVSNIFFVKGNRIHTPTVSTGILNGVIRAWVLENYDCIEGEFELKDLFDADEVFLTNSIMGIMKVRSIENKSEFTKLTVINDISEKYKNMLMDF